MESHSKHGEMIYARSGDGLYVNLFMASEARWKEQGLTVRQETRFPDEPRTTFVLTLDQPRRLDLRVRWPAWVAPANCGWPSTVSKIDVPGKPGGYVTIDREWQLRRSGAGGIADATSCRDAPPQPGLRGVLLRPDSAGRAVGDGRAFADGFHVPERRPGSSQGTAHG